MFASATSWLEKSAPDIDALNVFPVPDGDTGTNMLLTMRSTLEEAYRAPDKNASDVAEAMAKGALMGARGNSGVILSQILRGMARGLTGKESFTAVDLAGALKEAVDMAYRGISNPVEGTILTVMKEAAQAAEKQVSADGSDPVALLRMVVEAAGEAVAQTPHLLQVLREAGVVDAGGQGLYTILEGMLRYLTGEAGEMKFRKPQIIVSDIAATARLPQMVGAVEVPYGYCTEFLLKGEKLDTEKMRRHLVKKGESLIVVGDDAAVRIHIHTLDPGNIIHYATGMGTVHQTSIRNMDEQHQDWLEMQKEKTPVADTAIVAVCSGEGLEEVFSSLGVTAVVPGGQTMNPSIKELLSAVEAIPSEKIIILPNNKNVVSTAEQVPSLTQKTVKVLPTKTVPEGVAALLAFDYEADINTNAELMGKAIAAVKTIEVTRAVRSTKMNGLTIKKKQPIGLLGGELVAAGADNGEVVRKTLEKLDMGRAEVVTIYFGQDVEAEAAEQLNAGLKEIYPHLQIEVVRGGQPHYDYLISVE